MSFVLRKLDRRAAFHSVDWVRSGDVAGDALCNLRTQGNALSVWLIDDSRTNLERIIAAVAAGRMKLDKLDYALIGPEGLEELGICITQEKGASCDDDANALWHQDLRNLSGTKLVELGVCAAGVRGTPAVCVVTHGVGRRPPADEQVILDQPAARNRRTGRTRPKRCDS